MQTFVLEAETRPTNVTPAVLRTRKQIPAVCYGKGFENLHLILPYKAFAATYKKAGETNLVDLQLDGGKKNMKVLIHVVQSHPVSDEFIHVDLKNVRMDEKLTARVPVKTIGIAPAVKDFGGVLSLQTHEVEIRCLPADLIHEIVVDVSALKTLHDVLHVSDLQVPGSVEILSDKEKTIASVLAPRKEEDTPAGPLVMATPTVGGAVDPAAAPAGESKKDDKKKEEKKK